MRITHPEDPDMPFQDNANLADAEVAWNGERSRKLGAVTIGPLLAAAAGG